MIRRIKMGSEYQSFGPAASQSTLIFLSLLHKHPTLGYARKRESIKKGIYYENGKASV